MFVQLTACQGFTTSVLVILLLPGNSMSLHLPLGSWHVLARGLPRWRLERAERVSSLQDC